MKTAINTCVWNRGLTDATGFEAKRYTSGDATGDTSLFFMQTFYFPDEMNKLILASVRNTLISTSTHRWCVV